MPVASRRLLRSAAAVALTVSATSLAYAGSAAPAHASSDGFCPTSSGVTIVVDFQGLGGGIVARCAHVGGSATGLDALRAAGIPLTMVQRQPGFVCKLYGKPASDPCVNTPPASAYWSYWHSSNGGSWTYSNMGAGNRTIIPGGFEGWSFSDGSNPAPGIAPTRPKPSPNPPKTNPPAPKPTHTTQPAPRHTTQDGPGGAGSSGSHHSRPDHGSHAASTDAAGSAGASGGTAKKAKSATSTAKGSSKAHSTAHSKAHSKEAKAAKKKRHAHSSSSAAAAAGGSATPGGTAVAAGAPKLGDSDKMIHDSKTSGGVNATTVVGGGALGALALGGGIVAFVRRRNLG